MALRIWERIRGWFGRLFRRKVPPGRFETGAKLAWSGWLATRPLVWPRRDYLLYVPRGWSRWRRAPLLVLIHGCKQSPEEIAQATRIAEAADREGWLVLLPRQKQDANPWSCWNWFDTRTVAGTGEAAIVAAQIEEVAKSYRADRRRVIVAGMSAGGALSAIIGLRYAGLARAVVIHSGLACGAASSATSALKVMKHGPDNDIGAIADRVRAAASRSALPVPLLAIHGEQDDVVYPCNAIALVRQYLCLNGHPGAVASTGAPMVLPAADSEMRETLPSGRVVNTKEWRVDGRLAARYVAISDLGHAWSGGDASFPFNDAQLPDAVALIAAFARDAA